jgi:hypothetical protein
MQSCCSICSLWFCCSGSMSGYTPRVRTDSLCEIPWVLFRGLLYQKAARTLKCYLVAMLCGVYALDYCCALMYHLRFHSHPREGGLRRYQQKARVCVTLNKLRFDSCFVQMQLLKHSSQSSDGSNREFRYEGFKILHRE